MPLAPYPPACPSGACTQAESGSCVARRSRGDCTASRVDGWRAECSSTHRQTAPLIGISSTYGKRRHRSRTGSGSHLGRMSSAISPRAHCAGVQCFQAYAGGYPPCVPPWCCWFCGSPPPPCGVLLGTRGGDPPLGHAHALGPPHCVPTRYGCCCIFWGGRPCGAGWYCVQGGVDPLPVQASCGCYVGGDLYMVYPPTSQAYWTLRAVPCRWRWNCAGRHLMCMASAMSQRSHCAGVRAPPDP